jgi:hypothetical protein
MTAASQCHSPHMFHTCSTHALTRVLQRSRLAAPINQLLLASMNRALRASIEHQVNMCKTCLFVSSCRAHVSSYVGGDRSTQQLAMGGGWGREETKESDKTQRPSACPQGAALAKMQHSQPRLASSAPMVSVQSP